MQKLKRVILQCLMKQGPSDRFKIRQYFAHTTKPTNSSELIRQLTTLEEAGCIRNSNGIYTITTKGTKLMDLLKQVTEILS